MAFWATLAKTALRSSWNNVAPIRVTPSKMISEVSISGMLHHLQAMIIDPATVYAVPPRVAKSTFIESTMFLK